MDNAVMQVKIKEHDEAIKDHDRRLDRIEQESAEFRVHIQNLLKKIDELTGWIKALVVTLITSGVGFVIWYIQSLPR
jgi:hypothetical protein